MPRYKHCGSLTIFQNHVNTNFLKKHRFIFINHREHREHSGVSLKIRNRSRDFRSIEFYGVECR
jgi:hypothetical protein